MTKMERVEKFLWIRRHETKLGFVSRHHIVRFTSWDGTKINRRVADDLPTARKELKNLLARDRVCRMNGERFDQKERDAKAARVAEAQAQDRQKNRLTIEAWLKLCSTLPCMKIITAGKRRNQPRSENTIAGELIRYQHLSRHLGTVYLDSLSRNDLDRYVGLRAKDGIIRGGKMIPGKVAPGSVRNELASLNYSLKIAKQVGEDYRVAIADPDRREREVRQLREDTGLSESVLDSLRYVAQQNPSPAFSRSMPPSSQRDRTLSPDEEKRFFAAARRVAPPWFVRFSMLANLTGLDQSSLIELRESQLDFARGEIIAVRKKTREKHIAPMVPEARVILQEQLNENAKLKVRGIREDRRIFNWDYDSEWPLTRSVIENWHDKVCTEANIEDFWFRDWRHCAASRWAKMPQISPSLFCKAMGWAEGSSQHRTYIQLRTGDVGKAFQE